MCRKYSSIHSTLVLIIILSSAAALSLNSTLITVKAGEIAYLSCVPPLLKEATNETHNVTWVKLSTDEAISENASILEIENLQEFIRTKSYINNNITNLTEKYTALHDNENEWTLAIKEINPNDTGEYRCEVDTDAGTFIQIFTLEALKHKTVIHGVRRVHVGDRLVIDCYVENAASPPEYVRWYHNENEIISNDDRLQLYPVDPLGTSGIQIHPVSDNDEGVYRCEPSNSHPAEAYFSVLITEDVGENGVSSSLANNSPQKRMIIALEGTTVQLPCEQDVPPESVVIWAGLDRELTRNGVSLVDDYEKKSTFQAFVKKDNGWVLEIRDVNENSTGSYSCNVVDSSNHTISSSSVKLQVLTHTIEVLGRTRLMAGDTLKLTCYVRLVGTTKVSNVDWEYNGKLIDLWQNNTDVTLTKQKYYVKSLLTVKNIQRENSGQYVCIGSNMNIEPYVVEVKIYENNK